jgi:hypothetical protein
MPVVGVKDEVVSGGFVDDEGGGAAVEDEVAPEVDVELVWPQPLTISRIISITAKEINSSFFN